jgi:hypothetical protein
VARKNVAIENKTMSPYRFKTSPQRVYGSAC